MARARINLNRFRKVYPQMSKSPRMFAAELRPYKLTFNNSFSDQITISNFITPVVVLTAGSDPNDSSTDGNVNLWVQSIIRAPNGINWVVTIESSAPFTGEAHIHVGEAFVS